MKRKKLLNFRINAFEESALRRLAEFNKWSVSEQMRSLIRTEAGRQGLLTEYAPAPAPVEVSHENM